jgi:hypothetical protein
VVRVIATHTFDDIMRGIADGAIGHRLTHETRRELRQFGVYVARCTLVNFAECKVFKLLTTTPAHQGPATSQLFA